MDAEILGSVYITPVPFQTQSQVWMQNMTPSECPVANIARGESDNVGDLSMGCSMSADVVHT